jgi:hypothetical protein
MADYMPDMPDPGDPWVLEVILVLFLLLVVAAALYFGLTWCCDFTI